MPPRKNRTLNEIHEQESEDRENQFGEDKDSSFDEQSGRRPRQNQREDNRRWEFRMRVNILEFARDTLSPEGFMNWLVTVEKVFEFKEVPKNKRVSLITTKLHGRAAAWWQKLKMIRERDGKLRITSWQKMKKCMRANFIPHNYQRQMFQRLQNLKQGSESVEDYTTKFYQLITRNDIQEIEVQLNRQVGSSSSPAITGASSLGNVASCFAPSQTKAGGGNTGPVSRASGSSWLKYFNCDEPGHRQSKCKKADKRHLFVNPKGDDDSAYKEYEEFLVYDEEPECEEEYVSGDVGRHALFWWLKKGDEVIVSKRVHVPFSVGNTYKDNVSCDVVAMDAYHLLLDRPWEYDHDITHNGRTNTYSFLFGGVKITLMPNKPKEVVSKPNGTLLTLSQFEDELEMGNDGFGLQKIHNQPKGRYSYVRLVFLFDLSGHGPKTNLLIKSYGRFTEAFFFT
ncbi:putative reverse transcriptase domain-containing protein [Tanacetum coccineum]